MNTIKIGGVSVDSKYTLNELRAHLQRKLGNKDGASGWQFCVEIAYCGKESQLQADICAEAQKQLDTLMLQRSYTFVFYGSSENVFSTTLKLREHLRLSWRTAWDIAFRLRKGESVSVTTVLSNVQAVAAFINMPKVTFSSED